MEANPWGLVVFLLLGTTLYGVGITDPAILSITFVLFVIAWVAAGYAWDWHKYRDR